MANNDAHVVLICNVETGEIVSASDGQWVRCNTMKPGVYDLLAKTVPSPMTGEAIVVGWYIKPAFDRFPAPIHKVYGDARDRPAMVIEHHQTVSIPNKYSTNCLWVGMPGTGKSLSAEAVCNMAMNQLDYAVIRIQCALPIELLKQALALIPNGHVLYCDDLSRYYTEPKEYKEAMHVIDVSPTASKGRIVLVTTNDYASGAPENWVARPQRTPFFKLYNGDLSQETILEIIRDYVTDPNMIGYLVACINYGHVHKPMIVEDVVITLAKTAARLKDISKVSRSLRDMNYVLYDSFYFAINEQSRMVSDMYSGMFVQTINESGVVYERIRDDKEKPLVISDSRKLIMAESGLVDDLNADKLVVPWSFFVSSTSKALKELAGAFFGVSNLPDMNPSKSSYKFGDRVRDAIVMKDDSRPAPKTPNRGGEFENS